MDENKLNNLHDTYVLKGRISQSISNAKTAVLLAARSIIDTYI